MMLMGHLLVSAVRTSSYTGSRVTHMHKSTRAGCLQVLLQTLHVVRQRFECRPSTPPWQLSKHDRRCKNGRQACTAAGSKQDIVSFRFSRVG